MNGQTKPLEISRATEVTMEVADIVQDMFDYHPWSPEQTRHGSVVRTALIEAIRAIITVVPPSADRSTAIRKLREARMDCNSAITHGGKY